MSRPRKPAAEVAANRLDSSIKASKADVEARLNAEVTLGIKELTPSEEVLGDPIAYERWHELDKMFKKFPYVTSADNDKVNRCAYTFAQKQRISCEINRRRDEMELIGAPQEEIFDAIVKLERRLSNLRQELSKEEREIFLAPQARISALPLPKKKEKEKAPVSNLMEFNHYAAAVKG